MLQKVKECGVEVNDSTYRKVMAACAKANDSTQVGGLPAHSYGDFFFSLPASASDPFRRTLFLFFPAPAINVTDPLRSIARPLSLTINVDQTFHVCKQGSLKLPFRCRECRR